MGAHTVVRDVQFPSATLMDSSFVGRANYRESYCLDLARGNLAPPALFHAVFDHRPAWMKAALVTRNWFASKVGLEASSPQEILTPQERAEYRVGDKIGPWLIFALSERELVAGRDNRHLDFRLSILRVDGPSARQLQVSTACVVKNTFGMVYLSVVLPFHKRGLRLLLSSALTCGRL